MPSNLGFSHAPNRDDVLAAPRVHASPAAALRAADDPRLRRWLSVFLRGPEGNPELADALDSPAWWLLGPVWFPLGRLVRCCGPEPAMRFHDPELSWRRRIRNMTHDLRHGWQPAPLIVGAFGAWDMVVMDGNHRHAALTRAGRTSHPVVLVFDDPETRSAFVAHPAV